MTLQEKADKLLKKKKITGHDVGALLLDSFRVNIVPGEKQIKAEDFAELENRLHSETDRAVYLMFRNIYFPLISLRQKAITQNDTFIHNMTADRLLKEFVDNEAVLAETRDIPVIIEEKEYKKLIAAAKAVIKSNPAAAYYFVLDYIRLWEDKAPNTKIRNAVKYYKKQSPVLNKLRSENGTLFNNALLKPKYKLNGKEIDSIQDPAFIEAKKARALELTGKEDLTEYEKYIADKKKELLYKGPAATRDYMEAVSGTRLSSIDDTELMKLLEVSIGTDKKTEYLALDYINMENALRLYPVIEYCGTEADKYQEGRSSFELLSIYTNFAGPISNNLPEMIKKDYPVLDTAIVDYLNDEMENDFPTLPDFFVASISGCYDKHQEVLKRINEAGMAIIHKPYKKQEGKYIFPQFEFYRAWKKEEKSLKVFEPLAYMNCYNTLIELLAEVFDVPELLEFARIYIPDWNTYRDTFNSVLFSTYYNLGQYYINEELKIKRDTLKGLFPYDYMRSVSDFLPNKKVIEEVKKDLTALRDSKDPAGKLRMLEHFYITPLMDSVKL